MAFRIGPTPPPHPRFQRPPGDRPTSTPLFEQLLPTKWREIGFPVSSMRVSLSQDLVQHKYWNVDSARVEATGRAPQEFEATIPFVNGIVPGKGESWGTLYPTEFRKFFDAFYLDRTSGPLQHPEFGVIWCKPSTLEITHDAEHRDGVIVTARWVETLIDINDFEALTESPIKEAELAALSLEAEKKDLLALVPDAEWQDETFDTLVNKLSGVFDSGAATATLILNKPNQIINRAQTLQNSINRAKNVLTWPIQHGLERLKEAIRNVPSQTHTVYGTGRQIAVPIPASRKVSRYTTPTRMKASDVLAALPGMSMDDLLALNPMFAARPEVGPNTVVRYYV